MDLDLHVVAIAVLVVALGLPAAFIENGRMLWLVVLVATVLPQGVIVTHAIDRASRRVMRYIATNESLLAMFWLAYFTFRTIR